MSEVPCTAVLGKGKHVENVGVFPPWWRDRKQGKSVLKGKGKRGERVLKGKETKKQDHGGKGKKKEVPKGTAKKALKGKV